MVKKIIILNFAFFMLQCSSTPDVPTEKPTPLEKKSFIQTSSGLAYHDIFVGKGKTAKAGDLVTVHYTGWLEDGKRFDSSVVRNRPFQFTLGAGQVIAGWEEGISGMKTGGVRQLRIPPHLGYGASGAGNVIPPNASLIFEVKLLEVK